jgi:hypothetical protein
MFMGDCAKAGSDGWDNRLDALLAQYAGRCMPADKVLELQALCEAAGLDMAELAHESGIYFGLSVQLLNHTVVKV